MKLLVRIEVTPFRHMPFSPRQISEEQGRGKGDFLVIRPSCRQFGLIKFEALGINYRHFLPTAN
jgi:hypothetical protein